VGRMCFVRRRRYLVGRKRHRWVDLDGRRSQERRPRRAQGRTVVDSARASRHCSTRQMNEIWLSPQLTIAAGGY